MLFINPKQFLLDVLSRHDRRKEAMEGKLFKLPILGIWKCAFGKKDKETFAVPSIYLQKKGEG